MGSRWLLTGVLGLALGVFGCSSDEGRDARSGKNLGEGTGSTSGTGSGGSTDGSGGNAIAPPPQPEPEDCDSILTVVYRDFDESHPDFEREMAGDVVRLQLVEDQLGADQKPVFRSSLGCAGDHDDPRVCAEHNWVTEPVIESEETFNQWYRDVEGVNIRFERELELVETPPGSGKFVYDNDAFFPLGPEEGWGVTPANNGPNRNYLFTTEIHVRFKYVGGQVFTFRGDDDLWIFVNGKLALDLGSMHFPTEGSIDFDALAGELGISPGGSYDMDIFHAERHTSDSNFRVETNISCFEPVVIR